MGCAMNNNFRCITLVAALWVSIFPALAADPAQSGAWRMIDRPPLEKIRSAAEAGDPWGEMELGRAYHYGQVVPYDIDRAIEWYRRAAKRGVVSAMFSTVHLLAERQAGPEDVKEAKEWLERALAQGSWAAHHMLEAIDILGYVPKGVNVVWEEYFKAAEKGNMRARAKTCLISSEHMGVTEEQRQAWCMSAVEAGRPSALYVKARDDFKRAYRHERVEDRPAMVASAKTWLQKAAEAGHAPAQAELARRLALGDFFDKDKTAAFAWADKAARQGDAAGLAIGGLMLVRGMGTDKDQERGMAWLKEAARKGDRWAVCSLAHIHLRGIGVPRDPVEAGAWMLRHPENITHGRPRYDPQYGDLLFRSCSTTDANVRVILTPRRRALAHIRAGEMMAAEIEQKGVPVIEPK